MNDHIKRAKEIGNILVSQPVVTECEISSNTQSFFERKAELYREINQYVIEKYPNEPVSTLCMDYYDKKGNHVVKVIIKEPVTNGAKILEEIELCSTMNDW